MERQRGSPHDTGTTRRALPHRRAHAATVQFARARRTRRPHGPRPPIRGRILLPPARVPRGQRCTVAACASATGVTVLTRRQSSLELLLEGGAVALGPLGAGSAEPLAHVRVPERGAREGASGGAPERTRLCPVTARARRLQPRLELAVAVVPRVVNRGMPQLETKRAGMSECRHGVLAGGEVCTGRPTGASHPAEVFGRSTRTSAT